MAEESENSSKENLLAKLPEVLKPGDKKDENEGGVSSWIKNLAVLASVIATIGGVIIGLIQLKYVADTNLKSEQTKLDIALAQLQDQQKARKDQAKQHSKDNQFTNDQHRFDAEQHKDDQKFTVEQRNAEIARQDQVALSSLISHMFTDTHTGSEGDIASLTIYVNRGTASDATIGNALLVRLNHPRSPQEIEMAFTVIEQMGTRGLPYAIKANRLARQRYDEALMADYYTRIKKENEIEKQFAQGYNDGVTLQQPGIQSATSKDTLLDRNYVIAMININRPLFATTGYQLPDPEDYGGQSPIRLFGAAIEASNRAIQAGIEHWGPLEPLVLDLSKTYLFSSRNASSHWQSPLLRPNLRDAYIDLGAWVGMNSPVRIVDAIGELKWIKGKCEGATIVETPPTFQYNERFGFTVLNRNCDNINPNNPWMSERPAPFPAR